jgi:hypothetical protein
MKSIPIMLDSPQLALRQSSYRDFPDERLAILSMRLFGRIGNRQFPSCYGYHRYRDAADPVVKEYRYAPDAPQAVARSRSR